MSALTLLKSVFAPPPPPSELDRREMLRQLTVEALSHDPVWSGADLAVLAPRLLFTRWQVATGRLGDGAS